ncbi:hypothetical protein ACX5I6_16325 [Arthrobacter sp. MMS24-T111]
MDGALNGMVSRLLMAGYADFEALCLAQAAYLKEHKRVSGVPPTVLQRSQVTAAVNNALQILGRYAMGVEAHRQRILLWERVFGAGSWHEPIANDLIDSSIADQPKQPVGALDEPTEVFIQDEVSIESEEHNDNDSDYDESLEIMRGALRYFDGSDPNFSGDQHIAAATLFDGRGEDQQIWHGFLLTSKGKIGFFEDADALAENVEDGSPVVRDLGDLRTCSIYMPNQAVTRKDFSQLRFLGESKDFQFIMGFGPEHDLMRITLHYAAFPAHLRPEIGEAAQGFLYVLQKALALRAAIDGSFTSGGRYSRYFAGAVRYFGAPTDFDEDQIMVPATLNEIQGDEGRIGQDSLSASPALPYSRGLWPSRSPAERSSSSRFSWRSRSSSSWAWASPGR